MKHEMRLYELPFNEIKAGRKKVEIRLNDEKRQGVSIGDIIIFSLTDEPTKQLSVKVTSLDKYPTFRDLVEDTPLDWGGSHWKAKEEVIQSGLGFYPKEKEEKFGYLRIGIKLLS